MNQQTNPRNENPSAPRPGRSPDEQPETSVDVASARRARARRPRPAGPVSLGRHAGGSRTFAVAAPGRAADASRPQEQDGVDWCALWARYGEWMD
jgi:hypothetical protein